MDINGPLKVSVVEPSPEGNYELHIDFVDEFKNAAPEQRSQGFAVYLAELNSNLAGGELDERTTQGILLIQQICEQLAPVIQTDELPLNETLVIEVQRAPGVNLVDLLG